MSFNQLIDILKARKMLVASVFFTIVTLVVVISFLLPSKYTATAAVIIDSKSPDPINGMIMPGAMLPSHIATQLDVIRSDRVTIKAIRRLKLNEAPQLREQWQEDTKGVGDFEAWLAELLQGHLDVVPAKESSVINIAYTGSDPNFAAALTNAFVQSYIDTTLELRVEPARRFTTLFNEQAKQSREKLEDAQTTLSVFQREKGLLVTDERLDIENARLLNLSTQLVGLQALSAESRSRQSSAGANSAEVLNNPVVAGLKADLSRQEARLKELSARFGAEHPQVVELQANISELRIKIDNEIARVTSSMSISNKVNTSRTDQTRNDLQMQRENLLKMKATRDEASVLQRDVENAQRAYDALQTRYAQTSLESQSNQTDVSILKLASPPPAASSPKIMINTILSIVLGGMLAVGIAVLRESRDRRIRTESDILEHAGSILLGIMPKSKDAKKGILLPVKVSPRLAARSLPELPTPN